MVRIIRHFPANRPNGSNSNPVVDEGRPLHSVTPEDTFDDLIAGLTKQPDAALSDVAANESAPPRLPSVEEFHFEQAAARNMASKLAPNQKPRVKRRRPRYRSPDRDRWRFPDAQDEQSDGGGANGQTSRKAFAAPRGVGRGLFWSFCSSILIITGTSAVFGFVQPLNDLLPERMGNFLSDITDDLGARSASLLERTDVPPATFEVAGDGNASGSRSASPDQPMATAPVASAPPMPVAAGVQAAASSGGGSESVDQAKSPAATSEQAGKVGVKVLEMGAIDGIAARFAAAESAKPDVAAASDKEIDDQPRMAALQPPAKADPPPVTNAPALAKEPVPVVPAITKEPVPIAPAITKEPVPSVPATTEDPVPSAPSQPEISLSPAEIERLLARGHEMLERGDIASARLLFRRVVAAGDRRGAKGMGMTYDPRVFARLPVAGVTPDPEQAEIWYRKAQEESTFPTARSNIADTRRVQE